MKKIIAVALLATVLVACGEGGGCGEGMHYDMGAPVMTPIFTGKTTVIITTWPYAHCEPNR